MYRPDLYDYDAAAALTHYAPETVRHLCDRRDVTTPGEHYVIAKFKRGRLQRRVRMLTPAGIAKLLARRLDAKKPHE